MFVSHWYVTNLHLILVRFLFYVVFMFGVAIIEAILLCSEGRFVFFAWAIAVIHLGYLSLTNTFLCSRDELERRMTREARYDAGADTGNYVTFGIYFTLMIAAVAVDGLAIGYFVATPFTLAVAVAHFGYRALAGMETRTSAEPLPNGEHEGISVARWLGAQKAILIALGYCALLVAASALDGLVVGQFLASPVVFVAGLIHAALLMRALKD